MLVLILAARRFDLREELENRALRRSGHAARRAHGVAFDGRGDDRHALFLAQPVDGIYYPCPSKHSQAVNNFADIRLQTLPKTDNNWFCEVYIRTMLFSIDRLEPQELDVLARIDDLRRTLNYAVRQERRWTGVLRRVVFAKAIRSSNSIEGFNVTVEDAIAAVAGESPVDTDREKETWHAVTGYRDAMTYVLQLSDDPHFQFSTDLLRSLHFMMMKYDLSKHPGQWRPGSIFVRDEEKNQVVYEGPDAEMLPDLTAELGDWLNADTREHAMIRGAMAHLNLAMIHPFSDGSGRMARCLQSLVLAREGILSPQFCSIEEYVGHNTRAYYDVLAETGIGKWQPRRSAKGWIRFALTAHFRQAQTLLRRTREIQRLWGALEEELLRRQLQPDRLLFAVAEAAMSLRVRNSTYRAAAEVTNDVASRDLNQLVVAGLLIAHGEKRGRFYTVSPLVQEIRTKTQEKKEMEDPFSPTASSPEPSSSEQRLLF